MPSLSLEGKDEEVFTAWFLKNISPFPLLGSVPGEDREKLEEELRSRFVEFENRLQNKVPFK
jgi:hypothetical protein